METDRPLRVVVMGVAGSGKTTVGERLADAIGARFVEGDALHPAANVAKMSTGRPLSDDDRWPWLERIRDVLRDEAPVVVACSALKRRYRDLLREAGGVRFAHLRVDPRTAHDRAVHRTGHFMGPEMVASQFEALELPGADEADVVSVDASAPAEQLVVAIRRELAASG